mmetsp:Transcript_77527/g.149817  ORF Transcript_77527/g.149817 Transcript_77527/m.149817 type:complete len:202 (+) Transcript_77527:44-649(+)
MLNDLWGSPPDPWRRNRLSEWTSHDVHIGLEKPLSSQVYRRNFHYKPNAALASVRTGPVEVEHLPWATFRGQLNGDIGRELKGVTLGIQVERAGSGKQLVGTLVMEVGPHETVLQIKQRLAEIICVFAQCVRLIWREVDLPNNRAIATCGVDHGSILRAVVADAAQSASPRADYRTRSSLSRHRNWLTPRGRTPERSSQGL